MTSINPVEIQVRSLQYRDLDALDALVAQEGLDTMTRDGDSEEPPLQWVRRWYGPLKLLGLVRNPWQNLASFWVAEYDRQIRGLIQVVPVNYSRSTWQVLRVTCTGAKGSNGSLVLASDVGSQLLRHCLGNLWEARTWIAEVDVSDEAGTALYRKNGFQPLAQLTRWSIAPDQIQKLAERDFDAPNLLPVSSADAHLLYQLDTVAMPPILRQVFDRHVKDFRMGLVRRLAQTCQHWFGGVDVVRSYVFESQRKTATGYVKLQLSRTGDRPHQATLTVHPAYTWLYPELLTYIAKVAATYPAVPLLLTSADYQPEREAYLEQAQAERIDHSLLLSRSVWHKLRETRSVAEGLQLSDVLQGLQPARQPVPGRISLTPPMMVRDFAEL
jgi:hypothetical protein